MIAGVLAALLLVAAPASATPTATPPEPPLINRTSELRQFIEDCEQRGGVVRVGVDATTKKLVVSCITPWWRTINWE